MGLLSPVWAGHQQDSKETCGQCSQGEDLAPAGHDACPFPLYQCHQPRPGTGAAPSPGSVPSLRAPLSEALLFISCVAS